MELHWDDVELFLAIAETGSLSRAAKRLRVKQPTMSRRLADLEYRLGYQLFQRQVGGARVTSAGERLLEPARRMAECAGEIARAAGQGEAGGPRGVVRVTAPPGIAFDLVAPFAAVVRDKHPALRLEVLCSVHVLDLARGEADLALRLRPAATRDLVVVASLEVPVAVVAAKGYAAKLPKKPRLQDLDWIAWAPPFEDVSPNPELAAAVPDFRPAFTSDNYMVQWRACEAGLGAMIRGYFPHRFALPSTVIPLDVDLGPHKTSTLSLVCAKSALAVPRVRAVADLLAAEFARNRRAPAAKRSRPPNLRSRSPKLPCVSRAPRCLLLTPIRSWYPSRMALPASARSVVTGAGSGFGRALAIELGARRGRLVLSDVDVAGVEETAKQARTAGAADVKVLRCDVTQLAEVEALAAACDGPVDLVVNNAGVSAGGLVGELPMEDWRWTIEVDLFGVIHGCHVFVPMLRKQGRGHVLNVASAAGLVSMPYMAAYNVAKAGVVALSETLAAEVRGTGVGVTVLCPTFFQTNIVSSGRFVDAATRTRADKMMKRARPVREVVLAALASVDRGDLYAVPMADGRWLWRLKRAVPEAFGGLVVAGARAMGMQGKKR